MPLPSRETTETLMRDYGKTIFVAILVALSIRFFVVEAYRIPSSAMRPALEPGDTIFVSKWPFGVRFPGLTRSFTSARAPKRGEIVIFTLEQDDSSRDYIKRVVGMPGDVVAVKEGHLFIDDQPMEVPGSQKSNCATEKTLDGFQYPVCFETPALEDFAPAKVPADSVFLLGDLRKKSPREQGTDLPTHGWGIQPISALRGSALWIWLSVEPQASGVSTGWFPSLRFDRMFRRIQ